MRYFCTVLCVLLYSCQKEGKLPPITLSDDLLVFGWRGGMKELTINSDGHWSVSSELPDWLAINKKEGNGNDVISVTVERNNTGESRADKISFATSHHVAHLFISQADKERLYFEGKDEYVVGVADTVLRINVNNNIAYRTSILADNWITYSTFGTQIETSNKISQSTLNLSIAENLLPEDRYAKVVISNKDYDLSDTIRIKQIAGKTLHRDGLYQNLMASGEGKVNLVIMGDGFTKADLSIGGRYESLMKEANEHFFSIEPYKSYRDYFNVYMVVAESEEEGVGEKGYLNTVRNKFGTAFGSGTEITCNDELVFEYAKKVKELPEDKPLTIIVVLNSTKYAGTAYLYGNGNSIALCPMSTEEPPNDFEGVVHHEAGGHAFGFLCDEYVYYEKEMPDSRKKDIQEWQKLGFQMNLDFTDDSSKILWKDFIGLEKYQEVGAYEGGYEYQYGVWRCEENSCMNNNIPYFNVQSRWSIVKRIMDLSENNFTIQEFIEADNVRVPEVDSRSVNTHSFKPLGEPKWIKTK